MAYPYVAKRLLAGDTAEMREKLLEVIFDRDGRLRIERLENLLTVVENRQVPFRHAPGLSIATRHVPPEQLALFRDGDSMSAISRWDGAEPPAWLADTTAALPYHLLDAPDVLVLGAGSGADILRARLHGAVVHVLRFQSGRGLDLHDPPAVFALRADWQEDVLPHQHPVVLKRRLADGDAEQRVHQLRRPRQRRSQAAAVVIDEDALVTAVQPYRDVPDFVANVERSLRGFRVPR